MTSKYLFSMTAGAALLLTAGGCTTKSYVRKQTNPLVDHINQLDRATARNTNDIRKVNANVNNGIQTVQSSASQAMQAAQQAQGQATQVSTQLQKTGNQVQSMANTVANLDNYTVNSRQVVHFAFNRWNLTRNAQSKLDEVVTNLHQNPHMIATIKGYTDWTGPAAYNYKLSEWRANAVVSYLEQHGVQPYRIFKIGLGKNQYMASNRTLTGRKANRRVQISLMVNSLGQNASQAAATPASQSGQPR